MNIKELGVENIPGVGKSRALLYKKLSITNCYDLLYYFPRSYIDFTDISTIKEADIFNTVTVEAKLIYVQKPKYIGKKSVFEAQVEDRSGDILHITYFNNPYSIKSLLDGKYYLFHGKIEGNLIVKKMINPMIITKEEEGLLGVYKLTRGLTSNMIRTNVKYLLENIKSEEVLPFAILKKHNLIPQREALVKIHFPKKNIDIEKARKKIVFEELLIWQLALKIIQKGNDKKTNIKLKDDNLIDFLITLPFELTQGQKDAVADIIMDCKKSRPMNRLIQGDVGSGKTIVATAILYLFSKSGYQGTMMAPTDLLARQHYNTIKNFLSPFSINVALLVGSLTNKEKTLVREEIKEGKADIVIGTQTLFQDKTEFKSLGIVITDEQHRFGVDQRSKLAKKGDNPHTLVMSATPIPRSLALIIYGDLDISTIKSLPSGRKKIDTFLISGNKRNRAFSFIKGLLDEGRQGYIVCPAVSDGERDIKAVEKYAEDLKDTVFKNYSIGVLHGKLAKEEKECCMKSFAEGETKLLITTTVIEVGIDVKNAVFMMIENSELFGLSQLHQLRGRVGRGEFKSFCILVSDLKTPENGERLKTMCNESDGFEIANMDLKIRGPGDFFGNRQHGLPEFKLANIYLDMDLLSLTKKEADLIYSKDKNLETDFNLTIKQVTYDLIDKNIL